MLNETATYPVLKANGSNIQKTDDLVVRETPLTVYFNGEPVVTLLCSPAEIIELAHGFLLTEGFIQAAGDVLTINYYEKINEIWVEGKPLKTEEALMSKKFLSACCGKSRSSYAFANDARLAKTLTSPVRITLNEAYYYANYLQTHLPLFQSTGGIHSGGIAYRGEVLFSSYDIGRHNVFDKLFGKAFQQGIDLADHVVFFSGRISSEILIKVAKMNIPILIARSAPTDLALNLAQELNITVVGFARNNRLNIYTYPERILTDAE